MEQDYWERDFGGPELIHFIRIIDGGLMVVVNQTTYLASQISGYDEQVPPTDMNAWTMASYPNACAIDTDTFVSEVVSRRNQLHVFKWGDQFYIFPTAFFIDLGVFIGKKLARHGIV